MDKKDLEKEIRRRFAKQLEKLGGTGVEILIQEDLPPASEAAKHGFLLRSLGRVWDYTVFVGKVTAGSITLFVALMQVPDALHKFSVNYPETYSKAKQIVELVQRDDLKYHQAYDNEPGRDDYYIVHPRWIEQPVQFPPDDDPRDFAEQANVTLVATSGIPPNYEMNS